MVRNKVLSACASIALALTLATPVLAENNWHPSQTNQGVSQETTEITTSAGTFKITGDESVYQESGARILVSNASATSSDPTVQANLAKTKELYQKAQGTTASQFIKQNADLTAFETKAAALVGKTVSADSFVMASMFDVTPDSEALAIIKELGGVELTFNVPGITSDGKYLAIHWLSDGSTEVLDVTPGNGTAKIKFGTNFSPIMILKYSEGTSTSASIVNTGDHSNMLVYGVVAGVAIVIAGAAIVIRKNKAEEE